MYPHPALSIQRYVTIPALFTIPVATADTPPPTGAGNVMLTLDVYPAPALERVTNWTEPSVHIPVVAAAPEPPPPENVTIGATV